MGWVGGIVTTILIYRRGKGEDQSTLNTRAQAIKEHNTAFRKYIIILSLSHTSYISTYRWRILEGTSYTYRFTDKHCKYRKYNRMTNEQNRKKTSHHNSTLSPYRSAWMTSNDPQPSKDKHHDNGISDAADSSAFSMRVKFGRWLGSFSQQSIIIL